MKFFADFHIHSKYSRATSQEMRIPSISEWAKLKGIKLMGTGDFTHPGWLNELRELLTPVDNNLFKHGDTYFILTTEVNNIYEKHGKTKKIHNIIFVPTFESAELINSELAKYGNLESDGRPTISLDSEVMVKKIHELVPSAFIVPAHIWTPWFSVFGSHFGFDRIEECFGNETSRISALETGLSSDPPMNWRWSALDRFALISNSDAHSPQNIGREANCFDCELSYSEVVDSIRSQDSARFKFTIEFFPEEGKYHWDGHRKCEIRISPDEATAHNNICPKCGRPITVGVMHRVSALSDRNEQSSAGPVPMYRKVYPRQNKIPCHHLIPLLEIIADTLGKGKDTEKVAHEYNKLRHHWTEFDCLLEIPYDELQTVTSQEIAQSICAVRESKVDILPGYDGVYGKINVKKEQAKQEKQQLKLF